MPGVLKYKDGASYVPLYGGSEEVTISPNQPPIPTDLWLDTDDDTSYPDNILSGFRNVIRNGDMGVAQRGVGPFTANGYGIDGFSVSRNGGTCSVSRVAQAVGAGSPYCQVTISGQSAADHYVIHSSKIENVATLNGKVVTLSFDAVASAGGLKIGFEIYQAFGTGGSPSATVMTFVGTVTLSTVKTRYSTTFTIPSIAGKVLGTVDNNFLSVEMWLSSGTNYFSRSGIGIQNGTISLTDIQLEEGAVATPFERLPQQQQLDWCHRYYHRIGTGASYYNFGDGISAGADFMYNRVIPWMRTGPSIACSLPNTFVTSDGLAAPIAVTAFGPMSSQPDLIEAGFKSIGTAGRPYRLLANSTALAYLELSAEL